MTTATTKNLWAPVVKAKRGNDWIVWTCVRSTRREAKSAYIDGVEADHIKHHLKRVRFARVTIQEQP